jgi:SAM-dependent methyltransferase
MSKRNGRNGFDLATWRQVAPTLDARTWGAAYDRFFRDALQRSPQWRKWEKTGEIGLNERQGVIWEKIRRRGGSFLDVGCGPGFLTGALLAHGKDAWGCDCSIEAIRFAQKSTVTGADHYFKADLFELPDKQYDTVTCMELLEHLVDPEKALQRLWDLVAPNGVLFVSMPKRVNDFNLEHLHEFDDARVQAMLASVCEAGEERFPASCSQIQTQEGTTNWLLSVEKRPLDLRFLMVSGATSEAVQANDIAGDGRIKTGVFNWQRLFRGYAAPVAAMPEDLSQFDVIHCQLSGTNFDAPRQIRKRLGAGSDTKLVVNLDYALEFWFMYPPYPELLLEQLRYADYIMSVEPHAAKVIAEFTGRPVYVIPHPADVDAISALSTPARTRQEALVILHRDMADYLPYWMLKGSGLKTRVIGRLSPVSNATGSAIDYPAMLYDYLHEGYLGGEVVVGIMAKSMLAVDCYSHHVCGRSQIELAALGVPCVGHSNVWAQQECFPDLTVPAGDVLAARRHIQRLTQDPEWYDQIARQAQEKVRFFDYDHARTRYLTMLGRIEGDSRPVLPEGIEEVRLAPVRSMEPGEGALADPSYDLVGEPAL